MNETANAADVATYAKDQEFLSDGLKFKLSLTPEGFYLSCLEDSRKSVCLKWNEVIACHKGKVSVKVPTRVAEGSDDGKTFTVHYRVPKKDHLWRHLAKTFVSSVESPDEICSSVDKNCRKDRPSRLLVLINPAGGGGRGESIYKKTVAPLFKLANIETDVIVSKHSQHPEEIASTYDFSTVDGVIVSGGDGTYHKFTQILLRRLQKEAGLDIDDPKVVMKPFPIPIGLLPTGTGNGIAKGHYGSADAESAALIIISGQIFPKNIGIIRNQDKVFSFIGIVAGIGFLGDLMQLDLESQHPKAFRIPVGIFRVISKKRREFWVRLEYIPYRSKDSSVPVEDANAEPTWEVIEDVLTGVYCIPYVLAPQASTGRCRLDVKSPGVTLLLEKQSGKLRYMACMYKLIQFRNESFNNEVVQSLTVSRFRYKILEREGEVKSEYESRMEHYLNTDGEMRYMENTDLDITLSQNILQIFGTDLDTNQPS